MVRSGLGGAGAGNPEQKVPKDQVGLAAGAQNAPRRGPKNTGGPLRGPGVDLVSPAQRPEKFRG